MNITTVKIQDDGWLVNDSISVPNDPSNRHCKAVQKWLKTNEPDPEFTVEQIEKQTIESIIVAIQSELDKEARSLGYDSIHTAVTYAAETSVAKFQTEGKSFRKWRSLVWEYCNNILIDYKAGNIPEPTIEEMIAGIPTRT